MEKQEQLAHLMYDEYCASVGGKAFNGDNLPVSTEFFSDLSKTKQSDAWRNAAGVAMDFLLHGVGRVVPTPTRSAADSHGVEILESPGWSLQQDADDYARATAIEDTDTSSSVSSSSPEFGGGHFGGSGASGDWGGNDSSSSSSSDYGSSDSGSSDSGSSDNY